MSFVYEERVCMNNNILELYHNDNQVMNEAVDRIVIGIYGMQRQYGAKSFLFTGASSNVGTTSIALNIAIALAEAGWKTLFVDCDFRKGKEYKRISAEAGRDLASFLSNNETKAVDIVNQTTYPNLYYVSSGERFNTPVRLLCTEKMERVCNTFKNKYDFVIYDTPSINIVSDAKVLIPAVDRYVLVTGLNITTKKQIMDAKVALLEFEEKNGGIIASRMDMSQYKKAIKNYDYFDESNLKKKSKEASGNKITLRKVKGLKLPSISKIKINKESKRKAAGK